MNKDLQDMRENYQRGSLEASSLNNDPMLQFRSWFDEVKSSKVTEPNAMILSTATNDGFPSSRTVLLKELDSGFVFYTNYSSAKAADIESNPSASLLFLWKEMERQVRISGSVVRLEREKTLSYFQSRPRGSQLGAWVSNQSTVIADRSELEEELKRVEVKFEGLEVPCPEHWGGYRLIPQSIEFWQGRPSRLHDRMRYKMEGESWKIERLAP